MPMALKRDVYVAQSKCGDAKPIDLVHLSTQTMGDQLLEAEVLGIFTNQAKILEKLINSNAQRKTIIDAAHSLKGASRGIGAFKLAEIAERIETSGMSDQALKTELDAVTSYIASLH